MKPQLKILLIIIAVAIVLIYQLQGESVEEQTLQNVLSTIEGVGKVQLYYEVKEQQSLFMTTQQQQVSSGMLIVCEGCHSEAIKLMIVDTVSSVMNIPPHQIKVLPLVEEEQ